MDNIRALISSELNIIEGLLSNFIDPSNFIFTNLSDFISTKSKRIRSVLCLLYLKSQGLSIDNNVIRMLVSGELIHNASLLHDDVIDSSDIRRNEETIFKKYGSKISILSGDYILSLAVEQLLSINNPNILKIFLETTKKMCNAEINQYSYREKSIGIDEYIDIIEGKTASLFAAILKSGAHLLSINEDNAEKFGNLFGIIFQINNDLQPDSIRNDFNNGVKTAKDIIGIEKTLALKDNYKEDIRRVIVDIPKNEYKKGIEDLIELL